MVKPKPRIIVNYGLSFLQAINNQQSHIITNWSNRFQICIGKAEVNLVFYGYDKKSPRSITELIKFRIWLEQQKFPDLSLNYIEFSILPLATLTTRPMLLVCDHYLGTELFHKLIKLLKVNQETQLFFQVFSDICQTEFGEVH